MMIVRLFCPKCASEVSKSLVDYAEIDVLLPMSRPTEDGKYHVSCGRGHTSRVALHNLKFELLFEMGINALVDGYTREAVSSFSAALERYYEFYWRVAQAHLSVPDDVTNAAWKVLSSQSERQLGAFVSASVALTKEVPRLLNPNKEVPFRNNVIHKGYLPLESEATEFGDIVMILINEGLEKLRRIAPEALKAVYKSLIPKIEEETPDEIVGGINILTAIDVMNPPTAGDERGTTVSSHLPRVLKEREPRRMALLSNEEMARRFPDRARS